MLYFKDAPLAPSRMDAAQLAVLQTFRNSLPEKGGLFSTFEDQAGFEASLRASSLGDCTKVRQHLE